MNAAGRLLRGAAPASSSWAVGNARPDRGWTNKMRSKFCCVCEAGGDETGKKRCRIKGKRGRQPTALTNQPTAFSIDRRRCSFARRSIDPVRRSRTAGHNKKGQAQKVRSEGQSQPKGASFGLLWLL